MYYFYEELFIILGLMLLSIISVTFIFKAIAISGIAKRRGIKNNWLAFIPIAQHFMLGKILDNINAYRHKKTFFSIILLLLSLVYLALNFYIIFNLASHQTPDMIISALQQIFNILNIVILFFIYKDYSVKSWILFGVLSIFFKLDFIFLFCLRKKVPVSMCFSKQDEWQFEMNEPQLQMLWAGYHMQPYKMQTWAEFLMINFVPIQQYNPNMQGNYNNPYANQNMGNYNQYNNNNQQYNYQNTNMEEQYNQTNPDLENQNNDDDNFNQNNDDDNFNQNNDDDNFNQN